LRSLKNIIFLERTSGFAKIVVNIKDSEMYLLAKVFFTANSPFNSEVQLKFKVIRHFRPIIHVRESKDFNLHLSSLSYSRKPTKLEKLKGRELLED
jgi:hypothetical protein